VAVTLVKAAAELPVLDQPLASFTTVSFVNALSRGDRLIEQFPQLHLK
jgi:hypothetical protein